MNLQPEQISALEELLEEAWSAIGPAMAKNKPNILLKAINDEIRHDGLDPYYDLNAKGERLQALYEAIYLANEDLLK